MWALFLWIWLVNQLSKHAMQKEKDKAVALFTIWPLPSYLQPHYVSKVSLFFASQIHLCSFLGKDAVSQTHSFSPKTIMTLIMTVSPLWLCFFLFVFFHFSTLFLLLTVLPFCVIFDLWTVVATSVKWAHILSWYVRNATTHVPSARFGKEMSITSCLQGRPVLFLSYPIAITLPAFCVCALCSLDSVAVRLPVL